MKDYDELYIYKKQHKRKDGLLMEGEKLGQKVKFPDRLK